MVGQKLARRKQFILRKKRFEIKTYIHQNQLLICFFPKGDMLPVNQTLASTPWQENNFLRAIEQESMAENRDDATG
jgi:hypothetical protein